MSNAIAKPTSQMFGGLEKLDTKPVGGLEKTENTATGAPYLGFLTPKAKVYAQVKGALANLADSSPYYSDMDGYAAIDGNKFILLDSYQSWVKRDNGNKPIAASETNPDDWKHPLKENIEALILVFVRGTLKPAVACFNVAKTRVAHAAIKAIKEAAKPEWAARSEDHKASMIVPRPEFRVVTTINTSMTTSKEGNVMVNASGVAKPITAGEATLLGQALADPAFTKALDQARATLVYRVKGLKELAAAGK